VTTKTKRLLFYSAVAVFLLLSFLAILYAQGYKYSFSERKFQRTGVIALKVNTDAKIFLDNQIEGETSFFNNTFSVNRLLPGSYKLSVQKDSYSLWQKRVALEEGFIVDFSKILLLPEEGEEEKALFDEVGLLFKKLAPVPALKTSSNRTSELTEESFILDVKNKKLLQKIDQELKELATNVIGFKLSENKNKIAWWTSNELWVMWLNDTNYQPFYKKGDKELITRFLTPIQNATWFRDEDHIVLELEEIDSKGRSYSIYKVSEIDKRGGVNIIEL